MCVRMRKLFVLMMLTVASAGIFAQSLPAAFEEGALSVVADENDEHRLLLKVTLPVLSSSGDVLSDPLTKLVFSEMNMLGSFNPIATITDAGVLVPGANVEYVVEKASDGNHTYHAELFTAAGGNGGASAHIYVGFDQPGRVVNLHAVKADNGISVTWEAPVEGLNGGKMGDLNQITYTVRRGANLYDAQAVVLAEDISALQWTDETAFSEESLFCYIVTARSPYGTGYPSESNSIVVGEPSRLPFVENFDALLDEYGNTTTEHSTWQKSFGGDHYCAWQVGQEAVMGNGTMVKPHNGGGLLYAYYYGFWTLDQWDALTSGHICMEGATRPKLSFWYYEAVGGQASQHLLVQLSTDDETFSDLLDIEHGKADEAGWRLVTADLSAYAQQTVMLRFCSVAEGLGCVSVIVDQLLIEDDTTALEKVSDEQLPIAARRYSLQGQQVTDDYRGMTIGSDGRITTCRCR